MCSPRSCARRGVTIRLPDQPFRLLLLLLDRAGEVVTREELRDTLWAADTFVDFDTGLNSIVRKLRDTLGDSAEHPGFIETLPRRGYRFIASVTPVTADPVPEPEARGTARRDRGPSTKLGTVLRLSKGGSGWRGLPVGSWSPRRSGRWLSP